MTMTSVRSSDGSGSVPSSHEPDDPDREQDDGHDTGREKEDDRQDRARDPDARRAGQSGQRVLVAGDPPRPQAPATAAVLVRAVRGAAPAPESCRTKERWRRRSAQ